MSNFWKCPHCQNTQEKTDQLKVMAEAKRVNAIIFVNVTTRAFPCHFCGQTVDIGDVANGRLDVESPALSGSETDTNEEGSEGPVSAFVGAFLGGGALGFFGVGILVAIMNWLFGLGIMPVYKAGLVGAIIGSFGCAIISAIATFKRQKRQ